MKALDIVGQRFGRLVAVRYVKSSSQGAVWLFKCDCGNEIEIIAKRVKFSTKSCGCLARDIHARRCSKLNLRHGLTNTPTWRSWLAMRQRCENPNNPKFKHYGGRGISVCERWNTFESFLSDMGERPFGTTIDRINVDGNYELENCRWATAKEQRHNRRDSHRKTMGALFENGLIGVL